MTDKKAKEKAQCAAKKFRQEQAWLGKVSKQSSKGCTIFETRAATCWWEKETLGR